MRMEHTNYEMNDKLLDSAAWGPLRWTPRPIFNSSGLIIRSRTLKTTWIDSWDSPAPIDVRVKCIERKTAEIRNLKVSPLTSPLAESFYFCFNYTWLEWPCIVPVLKSSDWLLTHEANMRNGRALHQRSWTLLVTSRKNQWLHETIFERI